MLSMDYYVRLETPSHIVQVKRVLSADPPSGHNRGQMDAGSVYILTLGLRWRRPFHFCQLRTLLKPCVWCLVLSCMQWLPKVLVMLSMAAAR